MLDEVAAQQEIMEAAAATQNTMSPSSATQGSGFGVPLQETCIVELQNLRSEIEANFGFDNDSRLNEIYTQILDAMNETTKEDFLDWALNFKEEMLGLFLTIHFEPSEEL